MSEEIKAAWLAKQAESIEKALADGLGFDDIGPILKMGMESVALIKGMSNEEKSAAVIELACLFIDKTDTPWLPDAITDPVMKMAFKKWGPSLIALICDAAKGEVAINK